MADLQISPLTLKKMLDGEYNNDARSGYTISIKNGSSVIDTKACIFVDAAYDETNEQAYVQLQSAVYFEIDSGTTVDNLDVTSVDSVSYNIIDSEDIETRTYTANGTYTVSDLIVRVGG